MFVIVRSMLHSFIIIVYYSCKNILVYPNRSISIYHVLLVMQTNKKFMYGLQFNMD